MKKYFFNCTAVFFFALQFNFHLPLKSSLTLQENNSISASCSLPAPAYLNLSRVSTNSINASWASVSDAIGYKVTVYELDGGTPIYLTESEVGGTSITLGGLPSGVGYRFTVAAICSGSSVSDFIIGLDGNP